MSHMLDCASLFIRLVNVKATSFRASMSPWTRRPMSYLRPSGSTIWSTSFLAFGIYALKMLAFSDQEVVRMNCFSVKVTEDTGKVNKTPVCKNSKNMRSCHLSTAKITS